MAIKTALFLAETLFRHTMATKGAYFLAVCASPVANSPSDYFRSSLLSEIGPHSSQTESGMTLDRFYTEFCPTCTDKGVKQQKI